MRIGVDIGGTKIEAAALDDGFNIISRRRVPTPDEYGAILGAVGSLVGAVSGGARFQVCVCAPGSASGAGLSGAGRARCLAGRPLREDLEEELGGPVLLGNDADCFALAEARMGAGRGFGTVFGAVLGTGVGGGIVVDGRLCGGMSGAAGEWGHHTLHRDGRECGCGARGCVEAYISGPALEGRWQELGGAPLDMPGILASDGAPAGRWRAEFLEDFGYGLAAVMRVLDPDIVVLGGGLSNIGFLYTDGAESVRSRVPGRAAAPIVRNKLGDSAAVGACLLSTGT